MNNRLIARYLAGENNRSDEEQIKNWILSDPKNRELLSFYKEIWEASEKKSVEVKLFFNPEQDWQELRRKIDQDEMKANETPIWSQPRKRRYAKDHGRGFASLAKVAAIVFVASLIGIVAYQNFYQKPEKVSPALREISMERGQRGSITLSDGTKVTLNAESKIILPEFFQSNKRQVTLEGEAFFDVAHNPNRPFLINTGQAVVRVLGTSLDVRSYPGEESVQVVVSDGRVSLSSGNKCEKKSAILTAGERGQFLIEENRIISEKVKDLELFIGWKKGLMKFKEASMAKVAMDLERTYDINVNFKDRELRDLRLTAELKSHRIKSNLDVISTSLGLAYKMDQQDVIFYKEKE